MSKERDDRRRRGRFGRLAESLCVWHLRARGFRVLARRYRAPVGEIDIIGRRGRLVAFIEVKARRSRRLAGESLSPASAGESPAPPPL